MPMHAIHIFWRPNIIAACNSADQFRHIFAWYTPGCLNKEQHSVGCGDDSKQTRNYLFVPRQRKFAFEVGVQIF